MTENEALRRLAKVLDIGAEDARVKFESMATEHAAAFHDGRRLAYEHAAALTRRLIERRMIEGAG